jgi:chitinase
LNIDFPNPPIDPTAKQLPTIMISNTLAASLLASASIISSTLASPILIPNVVTQASSPRLVTYWGQTAGQPRLSEFCKDSTIDIIPIGFVNIFPDQAGGPGNNYGNACGSDLWVSPDGKQTQMLTTCSQIADDIQTCQQAGKKIFVSIGGAEPGGNFLASSDSAKAFADFLWGSYGPVQDPTLKQFPRPFGNTVVDGFDLDIESGADSFYSDLVNELRAKFATDPTGKTYEISAAPQCVVPDAHLDEAIMNSDIDYLFIQYYNTDSCSAASLFSSGSLNTNADVTFGWLQWLKDNSHNQNIQIFLGLPASTSAAHSQDYLSPSKAQALIQKYACDSKIGPMFGGVMLWDATYSELNTDAALNGQSYAEAIKGIFGGLTCNRPPVSTTTSTTTTTTVSLGEDVYQIKRKS